MNKNDNKISNLDELFDNDPTDRLPLLTEAAFADEAAQPPAIDADGIPTLLKSQALAGQPGDYGLRGIADAQAGASALEKELADHRLLVRTLQEELAAVEQENRTLRNEAATQNLEIARHISQLHESEDTLQALKKDFLDIEAQLELARTEADQTRQQLVQLRQELGSDDEHREDIASENQALLARMQDLETYIDGRKAEWRQAEESVATQTTALEHLRESVSLKEAYITELEERNDRQQEELDRQSRDMEALHSTIAAGNDAVKNVAMQLYSTQEQLDQLTAEQHRIDELTRELDEERSRSKEAEFAAQEIQQRFEGFEQRADQLAAELTERATAAEERLRQLESTRREELEELEQTKTDLLTSATQRDRLVIELQERDAQLQVLGDRMAALDNERSRTMEALSTQRHIIQNMKDELRSKLDAIAVLAQNHRTSGTASLHRADLQVTRKFDAHNETYRQEPTRMFVALDGEHALKLPIHKDSMTIGRSADNDIRIRRQFISRHHARIETDADGAVIHDLGSKNGVLVNSVRVGQQRLRDGDLVDLGEMKFRFVDLLKIAGDEPSLPDS